MLPDMSATLEGWSLPYTLKTVVRTTVDFEEANIVTAAQIKAVVQVADKTKLKALDIDWALRYLLVHTSEPIAYGQVIEFEGADYRIITEGDHTLYGFSEVVAEQTKQPLLLGVTIMSFTTITGDGFTALLGGSKTPNDSITVRAPTTMAATVALAYIDPDGVTTPYTDGAILAGAQVTALTGRDVVVGVDVTGYAADFTLEVGI